MKWVCIVHCLFKCNIELNIKVFFICNHPEEVFAFASMNVKRENKRIMFNSVDVLFYYFFSVKLINAYFIQIQAKFYQRKHVVLTSQLYYGI